MTTHTAAQQPARDYVHTRLTPCPGPCCDPNHDHETDPLDLPDGMHAPGTRGAHIRDLWEQRRAATATPPRLLAPLPELDIAVPVCALSPLAPESWDHLIVAP